MIRKRVLLSGFGLLLVPNGLAACGGDDGAACESFSACGGDLVGTWSFDDVCLDASVDLMIRGCPEASLDLADAMLEGTLTFAEEGSYSEAANLSFNTEIGFPQTCLPEGSSCDDLSDDDVTCSPSGSNCRCTSMFEEAGGEASGTWDVSGSSVILAVEGDEPSTLDFCVENDVLKLHFEEEGVVSVNYVLNRM